MPLIFFHNIILAQKPRLKVASLSQFILYDEKNQ